MATTAYKGTISEVLMQVLFYWQAQIAEQQHCEVIRELMDERSLQHALPSCS